MTIATLTPQELEKIIEGLLFVASEPVAETYLAEVVECPLEQVGTALANLAENCRRRGICLQRQEQKVQLVTAPELTGYIERFLGVECFGQALHPGPGNPGYYRLSPAHYPAGDRGHSRRQQ